jgi:hypothetical protein
VGLDPADRNLATVRRHWTSFRASQLGAAGLLHTVCADTACVNSAPAATAAFVAQGKFP